MCILCQQTSPKRWFGNRTMASFCDVTNSAQQIQMTTLCRWMNPPMKSFCVRHWSLRGAMSLLSVSFAIFRVYLIQIFFESKYSKKLLIFGFKYWRIRIHRIRYMHPYSWYEESTPAV